MPQTYRHLGSICSNIARSVVLALVVLVAKLRRTMMEFTPFSVKNSTVSKAAADICIQCTRVDGVECTAALLPLKNRGWSEWRSNRPTINDVTGYI